MSGLTLLKPLPLEDDTISFHEAKENEFNILQRLTYVTLGSKFKDQIGGKIEIIEAIVASHLRLPKPYRVRVSYRAVWKIEDVNLDIPVILQSKGAKPIRYLVMRIPIPFKTGESFRPGNGDEKIRSDAATCAWLNQECPSIPTPCLRGFGLSTGQNVCLLIINYSEYEHLITCIVHCTEKYVSHNQRLSISQTMGTIFAPISCPLRV